MADRLISADVLKANATREYKKYAVAATLLGFGKAFREIFTAFIEEIDNAPTIEAEPIVRCKDCKHHIQSECRSPWLQLPDYIPPIKTADWFYCADGERRKVEE